MVTTEKKFIVDTQKRKRKELKHTTTKNKSQRKTAREEERNKGAKNTLRKRLIKWQ